MAKAVRNRRGTVTGQVWQQPSGTADDPAAGFSEQESGYAVTSAEPEHRGLTRRQQALRSRFLTSTASATTEAVDADRFSVDDAMEVALDSLRRSSRLVEEMVSRSATAKHEFDLRSRRLNERLRRNGEQLAALVGDGR
jgi:hypothetical protein